VAGELTVANRNIASHSQRHAAAKPELLKTNRTDITQVKHSGAKNTQEGWDTGTLHGLDILKGLFRVQLLVSAPGLMKRVDGVRKISPSSPILEFFERDGQYV